MAFLLRLVVPDRPGMLGAVATALGQADADIVSLDVVERGPDGAVDDLVVELPGGALVDRLITAAQSVPGVIVESLRPYTGASDLHGDLELLEAIAAARTDALQVFVDGAPGVFRAAWAMLVDDGAVVAASRSAPELGALDTTWLPLSHARRIDPTEPWIPQQWRLLATELAAAPLGGAHHAVLLGRPGGPLFRASEVLRLGHLAGITGTVQSVAGSV